VLKFLVTGSSGFIGRALFSSLSEKSHLVKGTTRNIEKLSKKELDNFFYCNIDDKTDWSKILIDIDCVIHCAGQNRDISFFKNKNLENYLNVNAQGTKNLAYQAAKAGVKRIVYLSSVKVFKKNSNPSFLFRHNSETYCNDPYAISKLEAENELFKASKKTGLEVTIIRPAIVYGKGVKGNFNRLMRCVAKGIPLPFGSVKNKRSFIGLDNLLDLIIASANHPRAAGQILLATDDHDLSTSELISKIAIAMNKPIKIFPINVSLIRTFGNLIGRSSDMSRLINSFQIDISHTKQLLSWVPPNNIDEGLKKMVDDFKLRF
jgi:nucleoside-diphosphate-sugar epimerase